MATSNLGLKTFGHDEPFDFNEWNDNFVKIDTAVGEAKRGKAAYQHLDNSWFVDPVNQRGQTSYTGGVYAIDRWKTQIGTNINLMDGFIRITGDWDARQILGNKLIGTYTFAACAKVNVSGEYIQAIELYENDSNIASSMCTAVGEWKIYTCTATFTGANDIKNPMVSINNRAGSVSDASIDVKWAAMYEGAYTADTLPAYVPKGYAAELAECQRYYKRIRINVALSVSAIYVASSIINMRIRPTATLLKFDAYGKTVVTDMTGCSLECTADETLYAVLPTCVEHQVGALSIELDAEL